MLRKLMKHEFRATGRVMLPLFLLVLVTAVGANLATRSLADSGNGFLELIAVLLAMAFAIAIAGVCIMAFALMIQRFYKNLLQDEGYVMMTLPVSVHQHIWSKLLVSVVWDMVTAAVVVLACVILVFDVEVLGQFAAVLKEILSQLRFGENAVNAAVVTAEVMVLMFTVCIWMCLQFYSAMAIGHSFSNHKLLLSVVAYFGLEFVMELVIGGLLTVMNATGLDYTLTQALPRLHGEVAVHAGLLAVIVGVALYAAVYYFLTTYFLTRRLNLE